MACPLCLSFPIVVGDLTKLGKHLAEAHTKIKTEDGRACCSNCSITKPWNHKSDFAAEKTGQSYKHSCMSAYSRSDKAEDKRFSVFRCIVGVDFARVLYKQILMNFPQALAQISDFLPENDTHVEPTITVLLPPATMSIKIDKGNINHMAAFLRSPGLIKLYPFPCHSVEMRSKILGF